MTDRQQAAAKEWADRFRAYGLEERFELIGRDWTTDHGRRAAVKCRSCGEIFQTWGIAEIFKGRLRRLTCPHCGAGSDGGTVFSRSQAAADMAAYYSQGHTVKETADRFGATKSQVNNAARVRGASNGRPFGA